MKRISRIAFLFFLVAFGTHASEDLQQWPETAVMLAAADDPAAVYPFVNRAVAADRLGDAANALERLVRFRPELIQARADLVKLYDALGAGDLADEQREALAEAGITAADQGGITYAGFLAIGAGYDTNPASTPRDTVIDVFVEGLGLIQPVDLGLQRNESPLFFLQAGAEIRAPDIAPRSTMVVDLSGYGTLFAEDSDQNDGAALVRVGPEIALCAGLCATLC